jgi:SAM-dependent methyltransferase
MPDVHTHDHSAAPDEFVELLDLDGEVLHDYWSAALDRVRDAAAGTARTRLLDLGAGTGTGAIGLAQRFPEAQVVAVDVAADSLRRLRAKALDLGLAERIRTHETDLDAGWPDLGPLDLTWASMSLHHMADPDRTLRDVLAATRPGGLIAVAEFSEPLRFLPDDLAVGRPGFESRALAALSRAHSEELPTLGSDWASRLAATGWEVTDHHEFSIEKDPPRHPDAVRYARAWFARLSQGLAEQLEPDDRTTLAALLEQDGALLRRTGLHVRGVRTVTLARRGSADIHDR